MPIPRAVARLNRVGLNRLTVRLAPRLPGFGVVVHRGRRSGRAFRTPVNVFGADGDYVIALTYGAASDWVRNVIAAGGCDLLSRGRRLGLTAPRLVHGDARHAVPAVPRAILRVLGVEDFLVLSPPQT